MKYVKHIVFIKTHSKGTTCKKCQLSFHISTSELIVMLTSSKPYSQHLNLSAVVPIVTDARYQDQ